MDFVAVDVETANPSYASICQVGVADFSDGELVREWKSYIDPEDYFHPANVRIHGIDFPVVRGAPRLPDLERDLAERLGGKVVVSHTPFDRIALQQAFNKYGLVSLAARWLDTARVARRTWSECAYSGYGLRPVCELIGYDFIHHDALEDAKAAGQVLLAASAVAGLTVDEWLARCGMPIHPSSRSAPSTRREGNPEGLLFGEVAVFTGALRIPRGEAADLAAALGCDVAAGVTAKTTILVVGDQDVARLAGHDMSSKHRKAEALADKGQPIQILRESDFMALVDIETGSV